MFSQNNLQLLIYFIRSNKQQRACKYVNKWRHLSGLVKNINKNQRHNDGLICIVTFLPVCSTVLNDKISIKNYIIFPFIFFSQIKHLLNVSCRGSYPVTRSKGQHRFRWRKSFSNHRLSRESIRVCPIRQKILHRVSLHTIEANFNLQFDEVSRL